MSWRSQCRIDTGCDAGHRTACRIEEVQRCRQKPSQGFKNIFLLNKYIIYIYIKVKFFLEQKNLSRLGSRKLIQKIFKRKPKCIFFPCLYSPLNSLVVFVVSVGDWASVSLYSFVVLFETLFTPRVQTWVYLCSSMETFSAFKNSD